MDKTGDVLCSEVKSAINSVRSSNEVLQDSSDCSRWINSPVFELFHNNSIKSAIPLANAIASRKFSGNFEDAVLGLYHRVALLSLDNKVKRCPAVIDYQQWQLEVFKTSNTNIKSSRTVKWRHKCYITNMALAVSHFGPRFLLLINHIPHRMITNVSCSIFLSYQLETLTIFKV